MAKIYTVASGKGGVGKSTFCAGIARALSKKDKKVLLIDGDIGLRSLDIMLGVDEMVVYHWYDYISKECDQNKPLLFVSDNIDILPAPISYPQSLSKDDFKNMLDSYKDLYDFIFIDSPSGTGELPILYSECSDGVIVVATPDEISARGAYTLGNALVDSGYNETKIRLIINRFDEKAIKKGQLLNIDDMIDKTYIRLLGIIPNENYLHIKNALLYPEKFECDSNFAFLNIANRLLGKDLPLIL